ncbi:MAG: hypothetical protein K6G07_08110 [Lachnospiraceae bacterium]|nr:hypothetical protein [Lachnospiraceae bacterium]
MNGDSLKLSVSPIVQKDGKRLAYVTFEDADRSAEGAIPDCKILKNRGFTNEEASMLENYMKDNLVQLKKMAAGVNVMDAFMGKKK